MNLRLLISGLVLLSACSPGAGRDWTREGQAEGDKLTRANQPRTTANCQAAVKRYVADVGLPTDVADVREMQRGCEG